jgi:hypothetical protein
MKTCSFIDFKWPRFFAFGNIYQRDDEVTSMQVDRNGDGS